MLQNVYWVSFCNISEQDETGTQQPQQAWWRLDGGEINYGSLLWRLSLHVWNERKEHKVWRSVSLKAAIFSDGQQTKRRFSWFPQNKHQLVRGWGGQGLAVPDNTQINYGCCFEQDAPCLLTVTSREFSRYILNLAEFLKSSLTSLMILK